jgi:hypothetical protein
MALKTPLEMAVAPIYAKILPRRDKYWTLEELAPLSNLYAWSAFPIG